MARGQRRRERREAATDFEIQVATHGELGERETSYAREKLTRVAKLARHPILFARITLDERANPATERPAIAKASLDASGRLVRAHVAAHTMVEAIDLLEERLRKQFEQLAEHELARRHDTGVAERGGWRHGDLPTERPDFYPRSVDERELIRHKTYGLRAMSPEEAALEMDLLDYNFHLFTNPDTSEENVVYRRSDGSVGLLQVSPGPEAAKSVPFYVDPSPAPPMTLEDATERLNVSGAKFVFFVDPDTRRGSILYHRYDGHYGLIEAAGPGAV